MNETQDQKQQNIDQLLDEKLKPLIQEATTKALGITVSELTEDITAKLVKTPFIDFQINTLIKYKQAKRLFKKAYLQKMLELNLGNISEVADIAGAERRSIHRLINQLHINVHKIKEELIRPYDLKISAVSQAIEDVLAKYKPVIHPKKLEEMYKNVSQLSENLAKELPEKKVTLKEAEEEFERKYLQKALEENQHNITRTAKKIGLRYETLQRKMKVLGIR
ncbi:hypothetical protein HZC31_01460 [Candidatus Woesearchaeota archaeon]|nr:hypothetical protein [Candidatus Woesearchaeota archaeon]